MFERLKFWLSNYQKAKEIRVEYSLITEAGKEILRRDEIVTPIEPIILEYDWHCFEDYVKNDSRYVEMFNKRAEELLSINSKEGVQKLHRGEIYTGKYIVKCTWSIYVKTEKINWKEYQETYLK